MRPLVARIDTAALAHNLEVARAHSGRARVLAVIKANGYGHGLLRTARALRAADGFAVLTLDEAKALRTEGFHHPLVLLEGFFHPDEIREIARERLIPVIHRVDQVEALGRARIEEKIDVFLKLDTGMHRLGMAPLEGRESLLRLQGMPHIGGVTLMTHFACADDPEVGIDAQFSVFRSVAAGFRHPVSLANSAALMRYPEAHGDWVRPGIMLYGASPFPAQTGEEMGLLPAMHLESSLIAVRDVAKGGGIGYGAAFVAPADMRVGVVACGYADGYPRHACTGTPVQVEDRPSRILGRVSMDMLHVDLTDIPQAHVGSQVRLWGQGVPVERVAAAAGTISYELLAALASRVRIEEY